MTRRTKRPTPAANPSAPTVCYPRDASLDPQLVWRGKDAQDQRDLAVPVVPLHVQETIDPRLLLHADAPRLDSYRHAAAWTNRLILGDSLLVMTSLAENARLQGRVQMIFFDPPYGIKFGANWQVSTRDRHLKETRAQDLTRQPEQIKAFRDTWELGVHSYLSYLRDRLVVARTLLTETGSLFVQIGDENVHLVRCLLDEVFGSEQFIATIAFRKKKMPLGETYLFTTADYLLWYGKDRAQTKFRKLFVPRDAGSDGDFTYVDVPGKGPMSRTAAAKLGPLPAGARLFQSMDLRSSGRTESCVFPFEHAGRTFFPSAGKSWKTNREGMDKLRLADRLFCAGDALRYKLYFEDYPVQELSNVWMDTQGATDKRYVVQTADVVVQRCLLMTTDPGDLVLDPTCGSGTTACVAEQWGRRWITIDTSRVAVALARTRLMTAKFPCYRLAADGNVGTGFVCKRVPHVTLGSIANNPDIQPGMSRAQIDAAIARHADTVTLHDQPSEDRKRICVCGPFHVEGLSPHRALAVDFERPASEHAGVGPDFTTLILANLKAAGVQNTVERERLTFDRLQPFPGELVHAEGTCTTNGSSQRVAICIGPEHGTVSPELVCGAAEEAVQGVGFDLLVVCGFAFDPNVGAEAKQYGKLSVLTARINPDLAMGDELLKKTGAGNLFMVFGEPDVEINKQNDGRLIVALRGVDVFDPTSGAVRSHSTDDVACWFIDTEYNGACFFVRHAYFCGADRPYEKLKRTLRAEIDEETWTSHYATQSRPFDPPPTGQIAVKVVNHYGDEVLKVYAVSSRAQRRD